MTLSPLLERSYLKVADALFARLPQPLPAADVMRRACIVSHRGEHDNVRVMENTLKAFGRAQAEGVWGIELDVRWSADLVPVVIHDADLRRLYGLQALVGQLTREQLRREVPQIPSLAEVVERFGRRLHLMIEIKERVWRDAQRQSMILRETLCSLAPGQDYHFMALHPSILTAMTGFPRQSFVAIAYQWPDRFSRWVRRSSWGGLCAHYSLMRRSHIAEHQACGQKVGTGYPSSRRCLFRELNRGTDWIFSNHAAKLQGILNEYAHSSPAKQAP
jgi:glycerophosphoryl diester phosphodiesterase